MARYQDRFELDIEDIDRIERALRAEISRYSPRSANAQPSATERAEARRINELLGKIHNQKIFFAQVNDLGIPAG